MSASCSSHKPSSDDQMQEILVRLFAVAELLKSSNLVPDHDRADQNKTDSSTIPAQKSNDSEDEV